ncbi:MAG: S8 family serine peptidase [Planctomycetota bacterium]
MRTKTLMVSIVLGMIACDSGFGNPQTKGRLNRTGAVFIEDCQTPDAWNPKNFSPSRDANQNFVEDDLEFGAQDPIDVVLCLNRCAGPNDLARFAVHGQVEYVSPHVSVVSLKSVSIASALVLGQDAQVAFVELDRVCEPSLDVSLQAIKMTTSTEYAGNNVEDLYPVLDGSGVNIAIIDSGIDFGHESLPLSKFVGGWDFTSLPGFEGNPDDQMGHGTHVAGIAAGIGGPNGPRGVAPGAGLIDLAVFDPATGRTSESRVVAAIDKCIQMRRDWNIRVINLSLGALSDSAGDDAMSEAVNRAVRAGIVVCAAIGNRNLREVPGPAAADLAITVSAIDDQGTAARADDQLWVSVPGISGSNYGPRRIDGDLDTQDEQKPTCAAPGYQILAPQHNSTTQYVSLTGTSMASPHVAGLAAILVQVDDTRSPSDVRDLIVGAGTGVFDPKLGSGEIDALRSVEGTSAPLEHKITASDGEDLDLLGYAVAMSGDWAIAGAVNDDDRAQNAGAAYVFQWTGSQWTERAKLTASDGAAGDFFGWAVSISGNWAIVAAPYNHSAYLFENVGGTWVQRTRLSTGFPCWAVSIDGDRAVIGGDAAYVYEWNGSSWVQRARLEPDDGLSGTFGESLCVSGDRVIVGNSDADSSRGSAYVFEKSGSSWVQRARLIASDRRPDDRFGAAVSISGTFALVGAYLDDRNSTETDSGSAYVFERSGTTWVERAKLAPPDLGKSNQFGFSVSVSSDHAIVGAPKHSNAALSGGAAYVYDRGGSQWTLREKLTASDASNHAAFGWSVGVGGERVLVGADWDNELANGAGAVYVYDL